MRREERKMPLTYAKKRKKKKKKGSDHLVKQRGPRKGAPFERQLRGPRETGKMQGRKQPEASKAPPDGIQANTTT